VTSTIQSGTLSLVLEETPTGTLVTRTPLLSVVSDGIIMKHEGDIWYDSVFTPSYGIDYRASVENNGKYFGVKEQTKTADDVAFTYFIEGIIYNDKSLAGEMVDHTEDTDNDIIKFGGVDEDDAHEYTDEIDTTVENEITFARKSLAYKTRSGLVELLESGAAPDVIIKALNKWISIEAGGVFKHLNSPAITDSGERWKTLVVSKDGGGTYTIYIDNKGHIWKVDEDDQPPPEDNWRYEHCSDPSTYPDIILPAVAADDVILKDDQCYKVIGETEAATTGGPADDTYASCAACEGALTNEQWKRCDNDADLAILTEAHTDVDFAWLCSGAVWVKAYLDANTATAATDPTVLKQCGTTPTECADLVGWPASDDFGGVDCNSGAVGDTNHGVKWRVTAGYAIAAGVLGHSGIADNETTSNINTVGYTGDFTIEMDWAITSLSGSTSSRHNYMFCQIGGVEWSAYIQGSNKQLFYRVNGSPSNISNSISAGKWRIKRVGSTVTLSWHNGTSWSDLGNTSNTSAITRLSLFDWMRGGSAGSGNWDNVIIIDGSSADILIDPTGEACT